MSLKAVKVVGGLAGVAKCFGYDFTDATAQLKDAVESAVGRCDRKSSVEEFDAVQGVWGDLKAGEGRDEAKANGLRGKALKDLQALFQQQEAAVQDFNAGKPPHERKASVLDFCGLQRLLLPYKGACIFTAPENVDKINNEAAIDDASVGSTAPLEEENRKLKARIALYEQGN